MGVALNRYVEQGIVSIENNLAEWVLRLAVMGGKKGLSTRGNKGGWSGG